MLKERGKWLQLRFNIPNILEKKRNVEWMLKQSLKAFKLFQHRFNILSTRFNNVERGWQTLSTLPFNKIERMLKQMLKPFARAFRKIHWGVYRGCKMLADRLHRTRTDTTLSLSVGSTEWKSDRERLRKIHWSVYRGCKMLADRLHRTRTDTTRLSFCRFDWAKSGRERLSKIHWGVYRGCEMFAELLHRTRTVFSGVYVTWLTRTPMFLKREFTILNVTKLIVVSHKWEPQNQLRWL